MLFASPSFLFVFLPLCLAAYFASRTMATRNAVLIAASLIFYAWGEPAYVALMAAMTVVNYGAALAIDARDGPSRKSALIVAVGVNLAALSLFKYAGFLADSLNLVLAPAGLSVPRPQIPLPLGISFFTFHCLSYLMDTYRRRFPANRNLSQVALYIALFPQLIAGPIVRYKTIARRLVLRRHSLGRASAGMRIFIIGLAQKLLIADTLAPVADAVFDQSAKPGLAEAWLGASAYTLQIYFDFAGYSTMAIGLAIIFGFSLPRNFRTPYASTSITEFWRRWHISLSTWFRDYLYIPLGGNRGPAWKTWRNLVVVFLLCGLWHGAAWTFVLWGAWHGAFLVLERAGLGRWLKVLPRPAAWAYALLVVVLGWVLFRAESLTRASDVWAGMAGLHGLGELSAATALAFQPI
ncbi:MAG: MBOAT family protein, partial [Alphaproteobacteria bacterium]|nr:MBOAT family protein [Alphaproteobacteria bacterium]